MQSNKLSVGLIVVLMMLLFAAGASAQQERVLFNFTSNGVTGGVGSEPHGGLISDAVGNLYGTTIVGGASNLGLVFELSLQKSAGWSQKILYSFGGIDGANPECALIFDAAGNLYGITNTGAANTTCYNGGCGTVFELTPTATGWTEKVLHNFDNNGADGYTPNYGLIFDAAGNLMARQPKAERTMAAQPSS